MTAPNGVPITTPRPAAAGWQWVWSKLRRHPRLLLGGALLATSAALLTLGGPHLGWLALVLLWATWFVAGLLFLWKPVAELIGPLMYYDLLRTTRGGRLFSLRSLYGVFLLIVLLLVYMNWFGGRRGPARMLTGSRLAPQRAAQFAAEFFTAYMGVQYAMVLLLTPVVAAAAIAEEKERRTLEFVLASELLDREIVLGKLAARLVHLGMFLLVGLPILALLPFLGGVDPNLVFAGHAAILLTMLSLGSLSLLNSAYAGRVRRAVFLTLMEAGGYLALTSLCCTPLSSLGGSLNPLNWVGTGNPLVAWMRLMGALRVPGTTLADALPEVLRDFALFHVVVAATCCVWTWRRLRVWNADPRPIVPLSPKPCRPMAYLPELAHRHVLPGRPRPVLGAHPLLWKELHVEPGLGLWRFKLPRGRIPRILGALLVTYLLFHCCFLIAALPLSWMEEGRRVNSLLRIVGTPLACFLLLGIGLRAAGTLSSERERHTLDGLLTSPVSNGAILGAKGLASVACVRRGGWFLAGIWSIGFVTGGLELFALGLLPLAWAVYAALVAAIGLWFSLLSRTTLRATILTVLAVVTVSAGPFAFWSCLETAVAVAGLRRQWTWVGEVEAYRLAPPATLYLLAFCQGDRDLRGLASAEALQEMMLGLAGYALFATALWGLLLARFGSITGRMPHGTVRDASQKRFAPHASAKRR